MKKFSTVIIIVLVVLLLYFGNYDYEKERQPKDFPHPNTFSMDISCGEKASVGKATPIRCTFRDIGSGDYMLNYDDNVLFKVYVDGERINSTGAAEGSTGWFCIKHEEPCVEQYSFTPDKPGIHQIQVTAVFTINPIGIPKQPLDSRKPQEYSYQKTVVVDAE